MQNDATGSDLYCYTEALIPHVDMERLGLVDLEASRPGAVGVVHESHTQQLVIVVPGPVEHHAGARRCGDVALWVGRALQRTTDRWPTDMILGVFKMCEWKILAEFNCPP